MICKCILVVDDDRDIRNTLALALEMEGYTVQQAEDAIQALEILKNDKDKKEIGCIILDYMMPRMNGQQFLETAKAEAPYILKIPIILATARGSADHQMALPHTVATIQKPMDLEILYKTVRDVCGNPP